MTTKKRTTQVQKSMYYLDLYRGLNSLTPDLGPLQAHAARQRIKSMDPSRLTVHLHTCRACGSTHSLTYSLSQFLHWRQGEPDLSISMPHIDLHQRSLLLNGICQSCNETMAIESPTK